MQILLGILIAAAVGVAVHYLLPGREGRGVAVTPILAAAVGAVVWTGLTWTGVGIDSPWIWLAALVAPAIVTIPLALVLTAVHRRSDDAERARLRIT